MKKFGKLLPLVSTTIVGLCLSTGGCDVEEGRGEAEEDRFSNPFCDGDNETLAGIAVSVLEQAEYINSYAATAVDLLSIGCPDTTLEDIREIVEDEIDESQLNEYTSDMNSLVTLMNEYSRPDCTDPANSTKLKCNPYKVEDELGDDIDRVTQQGESSALTLWNRFTSNDESLNRRRLFHAQSLQLIAAGRLTFMGERIALEEIKSWPEDQDGDVETATTNRCSWANVVLPVIEDLETRFDDYFKPEKKVVDTWTTGCGAITGCKTAKRFKVCFPSVDGGEDCTSKSQVRKESFQCGGGYCVEGATDDEMFAEAASMIESGARVAVLGGAEYDKNVAMFQDIISTCESGLGSAPAPGSGNDPNPNSCQETNACGGMAPGGCYCDAICEQYGDCCSDGPC